MSAGRQFRPGFAVSAATIAFCALTVSLGMWQTRRAAEKESLQAALDAHSAEPRLALSAVPVAPEATTARRVAARGQYVARYAILLDNKVHRGRVGYQVVAPLRIAGGDMHVLVNRGWVPAGRTRDELPKVVTPADEP